MGCTISQPPTVSPSATYARRGRVLVIDDEPYIGLALRRALAPEAEVCSITDAAEALRLLEAGSRFDVVLCDLMMPTMDGIEFHRQLSSVLPDEAKRIVFITGGARTARVESFFRRVPNILLEKPIDIDALHAMIERRMGRRPSTRPTPVAAIEDHVA
jgi:CheY-like chemotaxis protein